MSVVSRKLKNGRVRWYIQYKFEGKRLSETVPAKNKRDAIKMLGKRIADIKEGRFYNLPTLDNRTLGDWAPEYLEIKRNDGIRNMRRIELSVKVLKEHFGKMKLREIKPSHIIAFKGKLLRTKSKKNPGKTLEASTVNRYLAQLKNMFSVAKKEGIVDANPVSDVKFSKEHGGRNRVISESEFEKLLSHCPEPLHGMILMAWETGMRRGEITNLTWNQVDLSNGLIKLPPGMTKTNEPRTIPISSRLDKYLDKLPRGLKSKRVFLYKGKGLQEFKRSWVRAKQEAGIEDLWFHDFRRCFITRMRRLGVDFYTVRAITGHKTLSAFECYQVIEEEDKIKAVAKLSAAQVQHEQNDESPTDQVGDNSSIKSDTS